MGYMGPAVEMEWHEELASQTLTPDGILTSFTMDRSVATDAGVAVFYENLRQQPGVAYTVSGTTINFTFTPASGKTLYLVFFASQTATTTPAAGTVVEASLDSTVASPVLLATATASASATIDFDAGIDFTAYTTYKVIVSDMAPATNDAYLYVRTSTDGGSTYDSTNEYDYAGNTASSSSGGPTLFNAIGAAQGLVNRPVASFGWGNAAGESGGLELTLFNPSGTDQTMMMIHSSYSDGSVTPGNSYAWVSIRVNVAEDVNGLRFLMSSGNIASGTFKLYGLR